MNQGNFDPIGAQGRVDPGAAIGVQSWERTYATILHLTILAAGTAIPFIPALVMWLIKREESTYIDDHGKEALNFQISLAIYVAGGFVLMFTVICFPLAILVWTGASVLALVGTIMAAVAASHGRYYRYPATLRLLK